MGIDLKKVEKGFKEAEGQWCDYPEDKDIKLKIRPLYPEKNSEFQRQCKLNGFRGGNQIDEEKLSRITHRYVIEDWQGITVDGSTECNDEALELMREYCADLIQFALIKSKALADEIILEQSKILKN